MEANVGGWVQVSDQLKFFHVAVMKRVAVTGVFSQDWQMVQNTIELGTSPLFDGTNVSITTTAASTIVGAPVQ